MKKILLGGIFNCDIIVQRHYTQHFQPHHNNPYTDETVLTEIGGTCGNVSCMLAYLGLNTFPIAHFDNSKLGLLLTQNLKDFGCDTRFVQNDEQGGTTILHCTHKLDKNTGQHATSIRRGNTADLNSRFPRYKHLRLREDLPIFLQHLDFTPDIFFFDIAEAGYRKLAAELLQRGTLIYFEAGASDKGTRLTDAIQYSHIIKFSNEEIPDVGFCNNYPDKLFIQTMNAQGLRFKLGNNPWITVLPYPVKKVVDWEGAGDWTTSQFLAALCNKNLCNTARFTIENITECLIVAQQTAALSVSHFGSKGLIHDR